MSEPKRKFAGGYNGDRYSVTGYCMGDKDYFIESENSITAKVIFKSQSLKNNFHGKSFDVFIFRNNDLILDYSYDLDLSIYGNSNIYSVVDNLAVNILFQLDENELDRLIPMINTSTGHSFSFDRQIKTYYIHCKSDHPCIDEYIIRKFNGKFYFDECSLYRKNKSINNILNNYSHFKYNELFYSLSDADAHFSSSGHYSTWFFMFDSNKSVLNYIFKKTDPFTLEEVEESHTIRVKDTDEFCEKTFEIIISHILSDDYIVNVMSKVVTDFGIDVTQDWKSFIRLFDMATI